MTFLRDIPCCHLRAELWAAIAQDATIQPAWMRDPRAAQTIFQVGSSAVGRPPLNSLSKPPQAAGNIHLVICGVSSEETEVKAPPCYLMSYRQLERLISSAASEAYGQWQNTQEQLACEACGSRRQPD